MPILTGGWMDVVQNFANLFAQLLETGFQVLSALTIVAGLAPSLRDLPRGVRAVQLGFARYLALALEFLLASDILGTLRAPTWQEIARLGAVAAIRTGLDFYLSRELEKAARDNPAELPSQMTLRPPFRT
jgi:uncharacterized membrane protein